jgi:hypothetical protein
MSNLVPRYTASAVFSNQGNGALTRDALPQTGIAAQLAPFYKGDKGDKGDKGESGQWLDNFNADPLAIYILNKS